MSETHGAAVVAAPAPGEAARAAAREVTLLCARPPARARIAAALATHATCVRAGTDVDISRVIVADAQDPDAIAAIDGLRVDERVPTWIAVSVAAEPDTADVLRALRAGATDYVSLAHGDAAQLAAALERTFAEARRRGNSRAAREALLVANRRLTDHVRELELDQRAGRRVQLGMLPPSPMAIDDVRLAHRIFPSLQLSGDFVDYFRLTDRHFCFYVADVSGHGASSAFVTVLLKNFSRRLRREYRREMLWRPGLVLEWLNAELLEMNLGKHVAMFMGIVDVGRRRLSYANAAHFPPPVLVVDEPGDGAPTQRELHVLERPGKALGWYEGVQYASESIALPHGFSLVVFSDGVLEIAPGETLATREASVRACIQAHAHDIDALCTALQLGGERALPDDVACLLLTEVEDA
jgi:sigma-B regulation protein RsbU (phosphoserine phosphatase)